MKFLKHSKIDLEYLFKSDQLVKVTLRKKVGGKQVYPELQVRLDSLTKYLPYCYFIINQIIEYQLLMKHTWYVGLSTKHIDKKINSDNRYTAIRILMALGVIERNGCYNCKGEFGKLFSKSYKISHDYLSDIVEFEMDIRLVTNKNNKSISIIQNGVINQSCVQGADSSTCRGYDYHSEANDNTVTLEEFNTLERDLISSTSSNTDNKGVRLIPLYHTAYQLKNLKNVSYDSQSAFELLEYEKANGLIDNHHSRKHRAPDFNRIQHQINKIMTKDISHSIDKTGRVTTTINQIDSEFRSFIKDKQGNDLMEIDFKASHLNHLLRIIEHDLKDGSIVTSIDKDSLKKEVIDLKHLIENGDVYNQVCIQHARHFQRQIQRDQAKDLVLQNWINGAYENRKLSRWIATLYPAITQYIHSINPIELVNGKSVRNRKPLSKRLLESEARLINEIIVERLAKEFPDSIAYTVFDSILIDEDHVDHLYRIMTEESERYFGFSVKLEMKENDVESKMGKKRKVCAKPKPKEIKYSNSIEDCRRGLEEFRVSREQHEHAFAEDAGIKSPHSEIDPESASLLT